jgi:hypothetical protein
MKSARPELCPSTRAIWPLPSTDALRRFVERRLVSLTAPQVRSSQPTASAVPAALAEPIQRRALGIGERSRGHRIAVGILTREERDGDLRRAVDAAAQALHGAQSDVGGPAIFVVDLGPSTAPSLRAHPDVVHLGRYEGTGDRAAHNLLMREAFARGADLYVALDCDGTLEPDSLAALSQMAAAHADHALVEAIRFPVEEPKVYNPYTFETPWASGSCLAVPRTVFEALGGFDSALASRCADVDLSWRARAAGIPVRICPRALFLAPSDGSRDDPRLVRTLVSSAVVLARKWGASEFEETMAKELSRLGTPEPDATATAVPERWRSVADFAHGLEFAPTRW